MALKKHSSPKTKPAKKLTTNKLAARRSAKPKTVHATEPYHPAFGVILIVVCAIIAAVLLPFAVKMLIKSVESDAMRFSSEYSSVEIDNVFQYKTATEIENVLEHGTGAVFLGFPSCPWCQSYAKMLNQLAKEKGLKEIYYYNIHDDRENNTATYQKLVQLLGDHLQYSNTGEKRIYVPNLTFVVDGKIIGNDYETSKDTLGLQDPSAYWTTERAAAWKERVGALIDELVKQTGCVTTCNE